MRPIHEIYKELKNHPDCLYANYFSKNVELEGFDESITDDADAYEKFDLNEIVEYYFNGGYNCLIEEIEVRLEYGWEHADPLSSVLTEDLIQKGYLKPKE